MLIVDFLGWTSVHGLRVGVDLNEFWRDMTPPEQRRDFPMGIKIKKPCFKTLKGAVYPKTEKKSNFHFFMDSDRL